jgi:hypothetical protein
MAPSPSSGCVRQRILTRAGQSGSAGERRQDEKKDKFEVARNPCPPCYLRKPASEGMIWYALMLAICTQLLRVVVVFGLTACVVVVLCLVIAPCFIYVLEHCAILGT